MGHKKSGRRVVHSSPTTVPCDISSNSADLIQPEPPTDIESSAATTINVTNTTPISLLQNGRITPADMRIGKQKLTRPKFTHRRLARSR